MINDNWLLLQLKVVGFWFVVILYSLYEMSLLYLIFDKGPLKPRFHWPARSGMVQFRTV